MYRAFTLHASEANASKAHAANAVAGTVYDVDSYGVWVATFFPVSIRGPVGPTGPTGPGA